MKYTQEYVDALQVAIARLKNTIRYQDEIIAKQQEELADMRLVVDRCGEGKK